MSYKTELQGNNIDLQSILDAVNALPEAGEDVPTVEQATPTITVSASGLITASATQSAGEVAAGTKTATKQMAVKGATTITPGTTEQIAIPEYTYALGAVTVEGDANLVAENIVKGKSIFGVDGSADMSGSGGDNGAALVDGSIVSFSDASITSVRNYAFYGCPSLTTVSLSTVTKAGAYAFSECTMLKDVSLPQLGTVESRTFANGSKLETVDLSNATYINSYAFQYCTSLKKIGFPKVRYISSGSFMSCSGLIALILRKTDAACELQNINAFSSTPIASGTGYIYVPSSMVAVYKATTNWANYADQIRAIEDYPAITGG